MPYHIAGIDVHKKMLAVAVADVAVEGDFHFERLKVGTSPVQLRALADWLVERDVWDMRMKCGVKWLNSSSTPGRSSTPPRDRSAAWRRGADRSVGVGNRCTRTPAIAWRGFPKGSHAESLELGDGESNGAESFNDGVHRARSRRSARESQW